MLRYWDAVCRHGSCDPICSLHLGMDGSPLTCMVFRSESLIPLMCQMTSLNRSLSFAGILGFVSGLIGSGRVWGLGLLPGLGRLRSSVSFSCS